MHVDERRGSSDMWIADNKGSHITTSQDSRDMKWVPCEKFYRWATSLLWWKQNQKREEWHDSEFEVQICTRELTWSQKKGLQDRSFSARASYLIHAYCAHCAGRLRLQPCSVRKTWEQNALIHFHRITHVVIYICTPWNPRTKKGIRGTILQTDGRQTSMMRSGVCFV